jgi:hypothetical protein
MRFPNSKRSKWEKEDWDTYPPEDKKVITAIIKMFAEEGMSYTEARGALDATYGELTRRRDYVTQMLPVLDITEG